MKTIFVFFFFLFCACSSVPTTETSQESVKLESMKEVSKDVKPVDETQIQDIKEEVSIGRMMASKMLGTFGYLENHEEAQKYVQLVGGSLVKQYGRSELTYYFSVLDDKDPNAFATPGGYIFVTRGLLAILKDQSELAGVLAHEIVHVNNKHMYLRVRPQRKTSTGETLSRVLSRGAGDIGKSLAQAVSAGMKTLLEEGLGQASEQDADAVGVIYASNAGYDSEGLVRVLGRLAKLNDKTVFNKTHPPFEARIEVINRVIGAEGLPRKGTLDESVLKQRFSSTMLKL